jgi:hypothetical protein
MDLVLSQIDYATDLEHHDARALGMHGFQKRTWSVGVQRHHLDDLPAAAAGRVRGPAESTRESERALFGSRRCRHPNWLNCGL